MKRTQLALGLHFWLRGREYVIKQRLKSGELQICDVITSVTSVISETALIQALFKGEMEIELTEQFDKLTKPNYLKSDFTQIPEELRQDAKRKYTYVNKIIELNLFSITQTTLKPIIEIVSQEINDASPPSWLTVYRWLKVYNSSGQDIRALVPRYLNRGDYRPKLSPEVIQIIDSSIKSIYLNLSRASVSDVYDETIRKIVHENKIRSDVGQKLLEIPHRSSIYRIVSKLEPFSVAQGRYGKRIASQLYDPVVSGPRPTRPGERVEIDHTKLDLFVVDTETKMPIGRPWLTSAIDKYSGVTLGYYLSFDPPSYLSVMQCLIHAISPKNYLQSRYPSVENSWDTYGLPEVIVVDNGKEFHSTHFEDACLQLGIAIQYCPPKIPWYKGAIERYFGTLNCQLLSDKPGKSFSNFMEQHDYDPLKNAVISFEAIQEILHIFIIDIHNQSSHPELKSPRSKVWSKGVESFPPALPISNQELKILVGSIISRKITRKGVELFGLIYNSSELASLHASGKVNSKTTVKYDPTDLSRIYVFDPIKCQFKEVPALNQDYTYKLTLWQHEVVKKLARIESKQVDIVALALAKDKIQQIVEREWNSSKKSQTRTYAARWKAIGRNHIETEYVDSCEQLQNFHYDNKLEPKQAPTGNNVMTDISDLGSALNPDILLQELCDDSTIPSLSLSKNIDDHSNRKKQRGGSKKSNTLKKETKASVNDAQKEIEKWKPDLTGWDVSIGLPN